MGNTYEMKKFSDLDYKFIYTAQLKIGSNEDDWYEKKEL